jgi:hypothetical protein
MAKAKKVTKEELESVVEVNGKINAEINNLGLLEMRKTDHIQLLQQSRVELSELQKVLEKKYGKVSIDLKDGKIEEIKEDEAE